MKLKQCPFCGDKVKAKPYFTEAATWIIDCGNCGLQMFDEEKNRLIDTWNTRADLDKAVADEREACAKVCEEIESIYGAPWDETGNICAEAIRNRGKKP